MNSPEGAPAPEQPIKQEILQPQESIFGNEQINVINKTAEEAKKEEQKNPEKIDAYKKKLDEIYEKSRANTAQIFENIARGNLGVKDKKWEEWKKQSEEKHKQEMERFRKEKEERDKKFKEERDRFAEEMKKREEEEKRKKQRERQETEAKRKEDEEKRKQEAGQNGDNRKSPETSLNNYYETLGVLPAASRKKIDSAYRKMAIKYHPDKNPGNEKIAKKQFQKVQEAYDFLTKN